MGSIPTEVHKISRFTVPDSQTHFLCVPKKVIRTNISMSMNICIVSYTVEGSILIDQLPGRMAFPTSGDRAFRSLADAIDSP